MQVCFQLLIVRKMFFDQLFFFLAVQHGLWDLSSQPRDGTWAPVVRDSLHGARRGRRGLTEGGVPHPGTEPGPWW